MNKKFCIECGYGNLYELEKPVLCGKCGRPFSSLASIKAPPPAARPKLNYRVVEDDEYDYGNHGYVKPKVSVAGDRPPTLKFKDCYENPSPKPGGPLRPMGTFVNRSAEQIQADLKAEMKLNAKDVSEFN